MQSAIFCHHSGIRGKPMQENVSMLEYRFETFPARFSWRGRVYQVDAVNECRTRQMAYHYWVRCDGQLLHLIHLLNSNRWALQLD